MTKACCDISFEILLPCVSAIMSCRQAEKRKRERTPWQEEGVGKNQILWIWFRTTAIIHILQGRDKLRVWDWHTHIVYLCVCCMLSHVWLFVTLWTVTCQVLLSMGFSRQEHWSRLPFPPPGDLPNPGIKAASPASPLRCGWIFHCWATREAYYIWNR